MFDPSNQIKDDYPPQKNLINYTLIILGTIYNYMSSTYLIYTFYTSESKIKAGKKKKNLKE